MSQRNIELSRSKDLLYFQGLGLVAGITTANFKVPEQGEFFSSEEYLLQLLEGGYFVRSDPKRLGKIVVLNSNQNRNYYSDDVMILPGQDKGFSPVMIMAAGDDPVVIISNPRSGLIALVNGSWENIILDLVRSTVVMLKNRFDNDNSETLAWIWSGLCRDCFHPRKDLFNYLMVENRKIDLRNNLSSRLISLGIREAHINSTNLCSCHSQFESGYFFHSESRLGDHGHPNNLLFVKPG